MERKLHPYPLPYYRCKDWFALEGDTTFRLDYDLNADSVVVDIGGYKGDFAQAIFDRHGANIFVFEPYQPYAREIENRFSANPKIRVFPFGLGAVDSLETFAISDDATSAYKQGDNTFQAQIRSVASVFSELGLVKIDLMKINVEGAEYDIIDQLAAAKTLETVRNFQIQFHDFVPDAVKRLNAARKILMATHVPTYMFSFVWENWRRADDDVNADLYRTLFLSGDHLRDTLARREYDVDTLKGETLALREDIARMSKLIDEMRSARPDALVSGAVPPPREEAGVGTSVLSRLFGPLVRLMHR